MVISSHVHITQIRSSLNTEDSALLQHLAQCWAHWRCSDTSRKLGKFLFPPSISFSSILVITVQMVDKRTRAWTSSNQTIHCYQNSVTYKSLSWSLTGSDPTNSANSSFWFLSFLILNHTLKNHVFYFSPKRTLWSSKGDFLNNPLIYFYSIKTNFSAQAISLICTTFFSLFSTLSRFWLKQHMLPYYCIPL